MIKKTIWRAFILVIFLLLAYVVWHGSIMWIVSGRVAEESAQRALFVQVEKDLEKHYEANGHYPSTLEELEITRYGDGSSPSTLKSFKYSSDGDSYTCEMTGAFTETLLKLPTKKNKTEEKP